MLALILLFLGATLVAVDHALRRGGLFKTTDETWPALYRPLLPEREVPYRTAARVGWRLTAPAGMPRSASLLLLPAALMALVWTVGFGLALGDLGEVLRGVRDAGFAAASIGWCALRAGSGWATVAAALGQWRGVFGLSAMTALALDATLWLVAVPCSDIRADDVQLAGAGLVVHALFGLGFAWSQWRRAGEPIDSQA